MDTNPVPYKEAADIKYVVFETAALLDSSAWIMKTFKEVFAELHEKYPFIKKPTKEELESFCGPPLDANLESMIGNSHPHYEKIREEAHRRYRELHDTRQGLDAVRPFIGVRTMLKDLQAKGFVLYIVTGKATEAVEASLKHWGLKEFFRSVRGTEAYGKPLTQEQIAERLVEDENKKGMDISPSNTVFICARRNSARIASRYGHVIGVTWAGTPADLFEEVDVSAIVSSSKEVRTTMNTLGGRWLDRAAKSSFDNLDLR